MSLRKKPRRKPSMTSRLIGYHYEGTIVDLPCVEAILRRAHETHIVTEYVVKQYGARGAGGDVVWFNGPPGHELRAVRDAMRPLVQEKA